jgi:hypothetical protein
VKSIIAGKKPLLTHRAKGRRAALVLDLSGRKYVAGEDRPAVFGSDDWMLEQQLRSEKEAKAWRRLREDLRATPLAASRANHGGSATLKALVRFGLATLGAHFAWLMAVATQVGQFELWLAMAAGFVITLALSMFGAARGIVHLLAQAAGWMIVAAVALSGVWLAFQFLN